MARLERLGARRKGEEMSLDFWLETPVGEEAECWHCKGTGKASKEPEEIYERNMTHNLNRMAHEAGIYDVLWQPNENGFHTAEDIVPVLQAGVDLLASDPERFKKFNPSNGWGDYDGFLDASQEILRACIENPKATIRTSR